MHVGAWGIRCFQFQNTNEFQWQFLAGEGEPNNRGEECLYTGAGITVPPRCKSVTIPVYCMSSVLWSVRKGGSLCL